MYTDHFIIYKLWDHSQLSTLLQVYKAYTFYEQKMYKLRMLIFYCIKNNKTQK